MSLTIDSSVQAAFTRLTNGEISWMVCGYTDTTYSNLELKSVGEGAGGMPEFIENLPDNDFAWGAFKVVGVDDRGNTVSRRPKYIFVKYSPADGMPAIKRAKVGRHKGDIKVIINAPIDFEVDNKAEFTEEVIIAKLRASGGAHQPTSYEFANYSS